MLSIKIRYFKGLKNDILDQQLWGFFQSAALGSSRLGV